MTDNDVGAEILSIITESLYDNPIVVFREYVQNSIDSIFNTLDYSKNCEIKIWNTGNDLFFLDNGKGIDKNNFQSEMIKIGASKKRKQENLGYKGIGRLSGVPYCEELLFVNIHDYKQRLLQIYTIDGKKYKKIKTEEEYATLSFPSLMNKIGEYSEDFTDHHEFILNILNQYADLMEKTNTGFFVILKNISDVLKKTIESDDFLLNLKWLLPIDFEPELYNSDKGLLFKDLSDNSIVKYCPIFFNGKQLFRPIKYEMLREYVCKSNFEYAVGFHSFRADKFFIENDNDFKGIRVYIDNMLLCDEKELLQSLAHYGLLSHTINGQLQSVRGIGAIIYITDKVNISANARRTFIEVTDNDSLKFLRLLSDFIDIIYDTRYSLSNYLSFVEKQNNDKEKLKKLKQEAQENLLKLAKEDVRLLTPEEPPFSELSSTEKKRIIKSKITNRLDKKIKEYLNMTEDFILENAYEDFFEWLKSNS